MKLKCKNNVKKTDSAWEKTYLPLTIGEDYEVIVQNTPSGTMVVYVFVDETWIAITHPTNSLLSLLNEYFVPKDYKEKQEDSIY